jgi:peptide/bleomycin uptake transporter
VLCVTLWYAAGADMGRALGFAIPQETAAGAVGVQVFWSPAFLWFYCYYAVAVGASSASGRSIHPIPGWPGRCSARH